ncbi:hypothetical protein BDN67DRAFT_1015858 [Paxillus ammoniavirescens]|nr:hypothetical protein BDN67DRAFT_1015858 [Paxillus ammoniavirescens]
MSELMVSSVRLVATTRTTSTSLLGFLTFRRPRELDEPNELDDESDDDDDDVVEDVSLSVDVDDSLSVDSESSDELPDDDGSWGVCLDLGNSWM